MNGLLVVLGLLFLVVGIITFMTGVVRVVFSEESGGRKEGGFLLLVGLALVFLAAGASFGYGLKPCEQ